MVAERCLCHSPRKTGSTPPVEASVSDLDDKDLAAIREMQRVRAPSARSLVVSLAVYGPTIVIAVLGVALGVYVERPRIAVGALAFALAWGVGASRSWDTACHRRQQQLWLRVAGAAILVVLGVSVTLFVSLDVWHRLFGYPLSEGTAAALRSTLDEHTAVLARRAERYQTVGSWREGLGPRPDLGACPGASGEADELPRGIDPRTDRGWNEGPANVSVIFPSGVPVFTEVDTAPLVAALEPYLTRPAPTPVDEAQLLEQAAILNVQPENLRFLVVDEFTPAVRLSDGRTVAGWLRGTAFTFTVGADRPRCAAYIDMEGVEGSAGFNTEAFALQVARAVDGAPFFVAGDVSHDLPTLDGARVAIVNDVATPLPDEGRVPLEGSDAWIEVAPLLTYTGLGFSMQYPSRVRVGDATPQRAVELMDTDGTILRVARGDCAALGESHAAISAVLRDSGTQRSATRMIGTARVRGAAATGTPGTMEVFFHDEGSGIQPAAEPVEATPPRCTLAFLETPGIIPRPWAAIALGSVRDEHAEAQHPDVPPAELVQGETRTPMRMDEALTVAATGQRVRVAFNPARMAQLAGLRVRVPPGAFARVGGGTSHESELVVVQGALELHLRAATAPAWGWPSSEGRLMRAQPGHPSAPLVLLGAARVGLIRTDAHPERVYAFEHEGRLLEVSLTHPAGTPDAELDSWLRAVVDTVTRAE